LIFREKKGRIRIWIEIGINNFGFGSLLPHNYGSELILIKNTSGGIYRKIDGAGA